MGRAPCCDKANVKKGPWSPEEDAKLKSYIEQNGTGGNWIALPQKIGLKRCGKSCRLRWLNYLRPNIKHGGFSEEEDRIICSLYVSIGSRWSIIAAQLPGRTDNDIKNYWNTRLKKKLLGKQRKDHHTSAGRKARRIPLDAYNPGIPNSAFEHANNHVMIPYWSAPVSATASSFTSCSPLNQGLSSGFGDYSSMRNLMIKQEPQANLHPPFLGDHQEINNQLMDMVSLESAAIAGQLMSSQCNLEGGLGQDMGQFGGNMDNPASTITTTTTTTNTFPAELEELMSSHPPCERIDALEFLAWEGMMMYNNATGSDTTCGESKGSWGETSTFMFPAMENLDQSCEGTPPSDDATYDELRYSREQ